VCVEDAAHQATACTNIRRQVGTEEERLFNTLLFCAAGLLGGFEG